MRFFWGRFAEPLDGYFGPETAPFGPPEVGAEAAEALAEEVEHDGKVVVGVGQNLFLARGDHVTGS